MADPRFNSSLIGTGAGLGATVGGPIGAGVGAATGLALAGGEYLWNKNQAKKDEAKRPIYQIPAEVQQGLSLAEQQALQGIPEEQKQQFISNLQRGTAYALGQSSSRKGGLAGLAALNENQNTAYGDLRSADAAARFQRQGRVYDQLGNVVNEKEQQWQINQENPFYERTARDQANRGALYRNVGNAAQLGLYGTRPNQLQQSPVNNNLSPDQIGAQMIQQQNPAPSNYVPSTEGYRTMGEGLG
jgi:hypothetical protein